METLPTLDVVLKGMGQEAQDVVSFEITAFDGGELPAFTAGAHVDIHLADGLSRSYSLANDPSQRDHYLLGVARSPESRGGSKLMHESLRLGTRLRIGLPRNNFPLIEEAPESVLIAGGIGITPLWCMVQRLESLGRRWTLHYCAHSRAHAAFLGTIEALAQQSRNGRLVLHLSDQSPSMRADLQTIVREASDGAHLYCCGPHRMIKAFQEATQGVPSERVHLEYFGAPEVAAASGEFSVVLARSGTRVDIPPGKTILEALLDAGIDVQYGCTQGVCGICEVSVLDGVPEHRDAILTDEAKKSNKSMILCCSGSKTPELILDL